MLEHVTICRPEVVIYFRIVGPRFSGVALLGSTNGRKVRLKRKGQPRCDYYGCHVLHCVTAAVAFASTTRHSVGQDESEDKRQSSEEKIIVMDRAEPFTRLVEIRMDHLNSVVPIQSPDKSISPLACAISLLVTLPSISILGLRLRLR